MPATKVVKISTKRKPRYVVLIIENGKRIRTNWVKAYKADKQGVPIPIDKFRRGMYSTTADESIAIKARDYARSEHPHCTYMIGRA